MPLSAKAMIALLDMRFDAKAHGRVIPWSQQVFENQIVSSFELRSTYKSLIGFSTVGLCINGAGSRNVNKLLSKR